MAGPSDIGARVPAVAGMFYPGDAAECQSAARSLLSADTPAAQSKRLLGGIVPHAGWMCSGSIAGQTIGTIAANRPQVDVVVVFGAIHTPIETDRAALDAHRRWLVPGGETELPREIHEKLSQITDLFAVDERFHRQEHAVEVELPLIQQAWRDANVTVLPIEVPVTEDAIAIGRETARRVSHDAKLNAVYLASSDLTHYGPSYRFTPVGIGPEALEWAKDNDRRLLEIVMQLDAEGVVPEVESHLNACGGGAIAAMIAACKELGAGDARVLRHANSCETLAEAGAPQTSDNAVGYASVLVGE
jgi:AmmeMemoRadiSam system protein B